MVGVWQINGLTHLRVSSGGNGGCHRLSLAAWPFRPLWPDSQPSICLSTSLLPAHWLWAISQKVGLPSKSSSRSGSIGSCVLPPLHTHPVSQSFRNDSWRANQEKNAIQHCAHWMQRTFKKHSGNSACWHWLCTRMDRGSCDVPPGLRKEVSLYSCPRKTWQRHISGGQLPHTVPSCKIGAFRKMAWVTVEISKWIQLPTETPAAGYWDTMSGILHVVSSPLTLTGEATLSRQKTREEQFYKQGGSWVFRGRWNIHHSLQNILISEKSKQNNSYAYFLD